MTPERNNEYPSAISLPEIIGVVVAMAVVVGLLFGAANYASSSGLLQDDSGSAGDEPATPSEDNQTNTVAANTTPDSTDSTTNTTSAAPDTSNVTGPGETPINETPSGVEQPTPTSPPNDTDTSSGSDGGFEGDDTTSDGDSDTTGEMGDNETEVDENHPNYGGPGDQHASIQDFEPIVDPGETVEFEGFVYTGLGEIDGEAELVVGHSPETVDTVEYETDERETGTTFTLEFEAGEPETTESFPVALETDHGTDVVELTVIGEEDQNNWTDEEREMASEMLTEFYDGYHEGISHAWSTEVNMEAANIAGETPPEREPWPLKEWDDPSEARQAGIEIGADEGAAPFGDEYTDLREEHLNQNQTQTAASSGD